MVEISMVRYPPNTNWCMQNACSMPTLILGEVLFKDILLMFFPKCLFRCSVCLFVLELWAFMGFFHFFSFPRVEAKQIKDAIFCHKCRSTLGKKPSIFPANWTCLGKMDNLRSEKRRRNSEKLHLFQRKGWDIFPPEIKSWTAQRTLEKKEDPIAVTISLRVQFWFSCPTKRRCKLEDDAKLPKPQILADS